MLIEYFLALTLVGLSAGCSNECCTFGGSCGDPVFDNCNGGSWNYQVDCSPHYYTCCLPQDPATPAQTTRKAITAVDTTSPTDRATRDATKATSPRTPRPPQSCGRVASTRIVGGENAVQSRWPWIAQLERDYFGWGQWEHFCGATLVSNEWLVTAAHCVAKYNEPEPSMFRVVLGEHDRSGKNGNELTEQVAEIIVHEDWSKDVPGSPSDLALLRLAKPVEFTEWIQPVCLPDYYDEDYHAGEDCWIAGWGDTKGTADNTILQEVKLNITEWNECQYKWVTGTGGKDYVKTSHVCIGNGVPGACNGDSGGPLVCARSGRHVLVGSTSFGAAGCLETEAPNVYTKISYFLDWIENRVY